MTKKITWLSNPYFDGNGLEEKLEQMAQKGWKCCKLTANTVHYQKIQPQNLKFSLVYLPSVDIMDGNLTYHQKNLQEFVEEDGWDLVANWYQVMVFCSSNPEAVPLHTAEEIKLESLHACGKKVYLKEKMVMAVLIFLVLLLEISYARYHPEEFYGSASLYRNLAMVLILVESLVCIGRYAWWYHQSKTAVALGGACQIWRKARGLSLITNVFLGLLIWEYGRSTVAYSGWAVLLQQVGYLALPLLCYPIFQHIRMQPLSRREKKSSYRWAVLPVAILYAFLAQLFYDFYQPPSREVGLADMPLTLQDIRPALPGEMPQLTEAYQNGTPLLSWGDYHQSVRDQKIFVETYGSASLTYRVFDTDYPFIQDRVLKSLLRLTQLEEMTGGSFAQVYHQGEVQAYHYTSNQTQYYYVISTPGRVITIHCNEDFTPEESRQAVVQLLTG